MNGIKLFKGHEIRSYSWKSSELVSITNQLKLKTQDGKNYLTDVLGMRRNNE